MNRLWICMIVFACPAMILAQSGASGTGGNPPAYQPVVAAPSTQVYNGGGYGYGGGSGGTVQGSVLNGMSQVISSAGQYNLNTSAAAINMTQARSNQMRNQVQACNTFWEKRNIGKAQREAERTPPMTPEQIARVARMGLPRALTPSQLDPVSGRLNWPGPLQDTSFESQRTELDPLVAKWASVGGLDYSEKSQVRETVDAMFAQLKALIRDIPPQDYSASRGFLNSVLFAVTKSTF